MNTGKKTVFAVSAIIILAVILAAVAIYYKLNSGDSGESVNLPVPSVGAVSQFDYFKGNKEASAILVEYSDFQCPACAAYYPLMKRLSEEFGDKMVFVYRHFPLSQHQNAEAAAIAVEAAGRQGKFWEMHDLIFDNQNEWSKSAKWSAKDVFVKYAQRLNLDAEKFKADFDLKEIKQKVANDLESGAKAQVRGTPTFFLNGEKLSNPGNYEEFKKIIEAAINKQ
ncbi:thioredoxin domain-containing protein [Candidatus Wolfebacteria bacterium]|nr:thioredoxin domain-containing protein [Candidatus Wolfebacteria bacterium]